jgi:putative ABC transport system permease protein
MDIAIISIPRLALAFVPVAVVFFLMWHWHLGFGRSFHAIARMLLQLSLIGYVLIYIFQTESGLVICGVLALMLVAASWIALNTFYLPRL